MRVIPRMACLLLGAVLLGPVSAPAGELPQLRTKVRLLASTPSVVPGERFTVGVMMTMEKGWHTYWKNPGEAGLPTHIEWTLPEGFSAGDIQWPLPHKYIEAGDVLTYGYEGETMLLVPITVAPTFHPDHPVTLTAKVEWLECARTCVPGQETVHLTLPASEQDSSGDHRALFAFYAAHVPPPFEEGRDLSMAVAYTREGLQIRLTPTGGRAFRVAAKDAFDFYPEQAGDLLVARTLVRARAEAVDLTVGLSLSQRVEGAQTLRGVLLTTFEDGKHRAQTVAITLPEDFLAGLPGGAPTTSSPSLLDRTFDLSQTHGESGQEALYFLFAVLGGILLNIMPCVLPVIALKVFGIVKMAGDEPARVKRLGWAFSGGILASFLALALLVIVLQLAGQQVGWGFQFQEPRFVIAMAALVFAFGLSLFGVFEIQLPGAAVMGLSTMVAQRGQGGKGYRASFAEGIFATILATPCTAPFLGSALGFAFSQPWWMILSIFTAVAFGMALPYLILTARPAWLRFLPKPGEWMVTAKQFMGFLMMATLLWLLYVLGKQMGMEAVIWTGAFLLSIGIACWLLGKYATLTASRRALRTTWIVAIALAVGGYLLFLEVGLDIRTAMAGVRPSEGAVEGGIPWKPFTLASLEEDLKGGRPVFVDFTAEWCLTCKVNEKTVLTSSDVVERFRALNVLAVKADWTNRNPDITRLLAKFGRSGVPLYVVFPPGRAEKPILLPEVITTGIVLDALEKAKGG